MRCTIGILGFMLLLTTLGGCYQEEAIPPKTTPDVTAPPPAGLEANPARPES